MPGAGGRGPFVRRRRGALAALVVIAVGALVLAPALRGSRAPHPGELVVSFLDIGQGDATLLQHGGVSVLFDTGPPGGPILRRLSESGVERLDALVITHAQADHEGMALEIVRAFKPRLVLDGGAGWSTPVQRGLPATASGPSPPTPASSSPSAASASSCCGRRGLRPAGGPRATPTAARSSRWRASATSTCCCPPTPSRTSPARSYSRTSRCSRSPTTAATTPACRRSWRAHDPSSRRSRSGAANTYGHPTPKTLAALEAVVPNVVRTDRDGTVRLRVSGNSERIERSR